MTGDELFELDPEEFVPARDRLVRELKKTDKAEAARVARLRRPTVAAWGINVVARRHPKAVAALLKAGDRLRAAQEKALRGDAGALRTATEERRKAVADVAGLVAEVLGERASAQAGAVSATLEAATVDAEVAELVEAGRLDKERSSAAAGFGFGEVGDWTPPPPRAKGAAKQAAKDERPALRVVDKPAAKKPAERKTAEKQPPEKKPAAQKPDDKLARQLREATAESKKRAGELHDAELAVRRLKEDLADATKALRDARTRAQKAELQVEQLRQKAWEQGERSRRR